MSEPATYPPDPHITRDLAPIIEREESGSTILLPVTPALQDEDGRLRAGPVATIVDIVCGETAIREVLPQWIATSSLSLQLRELPAQGTLRAHPRVLRKGRTTLVQEVALDHLETGTALDADGRVVGLQRVLAVRVRHERPRFDLACPRSPHAMGQFYARRGDMKEEKVRRCAIR